MNEQDIWLMECICTQNNLVRPRQGFLVIPLGAFSFLQTLFTHYSTPLYTSLPCTPWKYCLTLWVSHFPSFKLLKKFNLTSIVYSIQYTLYLVLYFRWKMRIFTFLSIVTWTQKSRWKKCIPAIIFGHCLITSY